MLQEYKMDAIYNSSIDLVKSLSEEKIKEAHDFLSYLNDKEEWESTMELNSPEILFEIKKGLDEINSGNFVDFKSIRRNV
jgi:hypothetical protein